MKDEDWAWAFFAYMLFATITLAGVVGSGLVQDTVGNDITVFLLWPLFVIKYLLLGIAFLVSNGLSLIF